jgi:hypothetical protein
MFAVAHTPRVVNEAFDLRTVSQLQLDQFTQNLKLGPKNGQEIRKAYHKVTHFCVPLRGEKTTV